MVPKTVRTLFASKLLLVHTFFLRYCILYFSDEVVSRKFFFVAEKTYIRKHIDFAAYAGTLIDQNFQRIPESFHIFSLFQLIVLGNTWLIILHQSLNRNIRTLKSAFQSKLFFFGLYLYFYGSHNASKCAITFFNPTVGFFLQVSLVPLFHYDLIPRGINLKSYKYGGGFRWRRMCCVFSVDIRFVLILHRVPAKFVHPEIETIFLCYQIQCTLWWSQLQQFYLWANTRRENNPFLCLLVWFEILLVQKFSEIVQLWSNSFSNWGFSWFTYLFASEISSTKLSPPDMGSAGKHLFWSWHQIADGPKVPETDINMDLSRNRKHGSP